MTEELIKQLQGTHSVLMEKHKVVSELYLSYGDGVAAAMNYIGDHLSALEGALDQIVGNFPDASTLSSYIGVREGLRKARGDVGKTILGITFVSSRTRIKEMSLEGYREVIRHLPVLANDLKSTYSRLVSAIQPIGERGLEVRQTPPIYPIVFTPQTSQITTVKETEENPRVEAESKADVPLIKPEDIEIVPGTGEQMKEIEKLAIEVAAKGFMCDTVGRILNHEEILSSTINSYGDIPQTIRDAREDFLKVVARQKDTEQLDLISTDILVAYLYRVEGWISKDGYQTNRLKEALERFPKRK